MANSSNKQLVTKVSFLVALIIVSVLLLLIIPFYDGLEFMVSRWVGKEEYSHGFFLPVIALYLLWERRFILMRQNYTGSYWGAVMVFIGLILCLVGSLATIFEAIEYGFVLTVWGVVLSITGLKTFKYYFVPLLILFLMIPLPNFIYHNLSSQLQLISSKIGVSIIQLFSIPVYLEGNVIDLGSMKLQVVEACSGLRYLFPLMTLGFILGYMFNAPFLYRVIVFFSSIPITILMNSFRIGLIGVTVEYWGKAAAEGVLHDFEGWVVFMSSLLVLMFEIWLIARLRGDRRSVSDLLSTAGANAEQENYQSSDQSDTVWLRLQRPFYVTVVIVFALSIAAYLVPQRADVIPERSSFASFPNQLDDWSGVKGYLTPDYLGSLKLTDYILADYEKVDASPVNFYVSYYDTQKKGRSAHSPKSCIPGDGWEISEFTQETVQVNGVAMPVNRAIISKGANKTLVYYWFQQRGRFITNEYLVKFYLLIDALVSGRTDGAMIRLTAQIPSYQNAEVVDQQLQSFMQALYPELNNYVPN